jgi:hypothetical protein
MKSLRKPFGSASLAALVAVALLVAPLCAPWCASGSCSPEKADRIATSGAGHCGAAMEMREHGNDSRWSGVKSCPVTEAPAVVRNEDAGPKVPFGGQPGAMARSFGLRTAQEQVGVERSLRDAVNSPPLGCPSSVVLRI